LEELKQLTGTSGDGAYFQVDQSESVIKNATDLQNIWADRYKNDQPCSLQIKVVLPVVNNLKIEIEKNNSKLKPLTEKERTFVVPPIVSWKTKNVNSVYPGHSEIKTKLNGTQRTIDEWNKTKTYSFPQQRDVSSSCDEKVNNECCVMKTMELSYQPWKDDQNAKLYSIGNPFTTLAQQQNILLEKPKKFENHH